MYKTQLTIPIYNHNITVQVVAEKGLLRLKEKEKNRRNCANRSLFIEKLGELSTKLLKARAYYIATIATYRLQFDDARWFGWHSSNRKEMWQFLSAN